MANPATKVAQFNGSLDGFTGVDPIRYDNGLWLEEGTTNLVPNPSVESAITGWSFNGAGATVTRVTTEHYLGVASGQVACAGSGANEGVASAVSVDGAQGDTWASSWYVKGNAGSEALKIAIAERTAADAGIVDQVGSQFSVTTTWERHSFSATLAQATVGKIRHRLISHVQQAKTFFFDGVQLEKKPYATSLAVSDMGNGYSAGTNTHIRAASSASISPSGILSPSSGALAFRVTPTIETGVEEIWGECGVKGSGTDHVQWGRDSSKHPFVEWNSNNATYQRLTGSETLNALTAYDLYLGQSGTAISLAVDAGTLQTGTRAAASASWGAGNLTLEATKGGVVYHNFATFDRTLTREEISTLNSASIWTPSVLDGINAAILRRAR